MTFITNNFKLSAATIAAIYRDRWSIESFFRTIKQNFEIKSFLGTSENAVKIQICAALIAILLLKYLKNQSKEKWSFSGFLFIIRQNIHQHIKLFYLIDNAKIQLSNLNKYHIEAFVPPGQTSKLF
jgi:transposase